MLSEWQRNLLEKIGGSQAYMEKGRQTFKIPWNN